MTEKIREYQGKQIAVRYNVKRCIHAAECVRGLPAVFDTKQHPWVSPDQASAAEVAAVVERCPTGALQYERRDGGLQEVIPEQNTIIMAPNGPLYLRGELTVTSAAGTEAWHDTRLALCRCGASQNKPFCDNSHIEAGFQAAGSREAVAGQDPRLAAGGKLAVNPAANGPLLLQGHFEIQGSDGQLIFQGDKAALCRCGQSQNKPFCDGTHRQVGFQAD
jgi:CDGSH-type Zn-finger protein/uncharacterized Fe-S cluster protein YjdI